MSAEIAATELGRTGRRRAHWRWSLMALGVVVVVVCALIVWLRGGRVVSTDDAYVQAARSTISSNVTGQVATILVKDNQRVHRGDVLFQLDDAAFRIAVEEATAKIASAGLQMDAGRAAYQQQLALINSAEDNLNTLLPGNAEPLRQLRTPDGAAREDIPRAKRPARGATAVRSKRRRMSS